MNFKDIIASDTDIFLNNNEFADTCIINGVSVTVLVDVDKLKERHTKDFDGALIGDILYFIKINDYPSGNPKAGDAQVFNNKVCTIEDVKKDKDIYEIIISYNSR